MAEKTEPKREERAAPPAAAPAHAPEHKKPEHGSFVKSTPFLLGLVMVVEGGLLLGVFKMLGGAPHSAQGADVATHDTGHDKTTHGGGESSSKGAGRVELSVLSFKAPNSLKGRTYLYDVVIYAAVKGEVKEKVAAALKDREATIEDRMRTIVAQMDPEKLGGGSEPGLETLRRQVKCQLEEIVGEGLIEEVLVRRCIPYRADF